MSGLVAPHEVFGLLRPGVDAHTLGVSHVEQLLKDCGHRVVVADARVCAAANHPRKRGQLAIIRSWIETNAISRLGFSYRLDPDDAVRQFGELFFQLEKHRLLQPEGGPLRGFYFAGLPAACGEIESEYRGRVRVFSGDETASETLARLDIAPGRIPASLHRASQYDDARLEFGRRLIARGAYRAIEPPDRSGYPGFGTMRDRLVDRIAHSRKKNLPPLLRAHVGPYLPDRAKAVQLFLEWSREMARDGFLDVLSIGTSQLSQSDFGRDWEDRANGGGVPINSAAELLAIWLAARPMLVRTYAGTNDIPALAAIYERTLNMAWHALSFWWFSQIDGRGPLPVHRNLEEHLATLRVIATAGKPFEPNIPHHFAFRGADDVTYVASAVLAARVAKAAGVRHLVLQNMMNTPKFTWGVQDLAKARVMLAFVRRLEDKNFRVFYQPRAGLDYFSPDLEKARAQLAAVTALMRDVEPHRPPGPDIIHVVSYSEASHLADPAVVKESAQITLAALAEYRSLLDEQEVSERARQLHDEVACVLRSIERNIPNPCSAEGLYQIFAAGYLPVPWLWEGREEFRHAVAWSTRVVNGSVKVVDGEGLPIPVANRVRVAAEIAGGERQHPERT